MKATALLIEDHHHLRRALNVLRHMSARARQNAEFDPGAASKLLRFLQDFADQHHQGKEENVLFPALLRDRHQKNYPSLCALIFEHNRERSLAEGLEEAIQTKAASDFSYYADRLADVLTRHIEVEERDLFALADAVLDPHQDAAVAEEMRRYEQVWQVEKLPAQLRILAELETEYLGRARAQKVAHG